MWTMFSGWRVGIIQLPKNLLFRQNSSFWKLGQIWWNFIWSFIWWRLWKFNAFLKYFMERILFSANSRTYIFTPSRLGFTLSFFIGLHDRSSANSLFRWHLEVIVYVHCSITLFVSIGCWYIYLIHVPLLHPLSL